MQNFGASSIGRLLYSLTDLYRRRAVPTFWPIDTSR